MPILINPFLVWADLILWHSQLLPHMPWSCHWKPFNSSNMQTFLSHPQVYAKANSSPWSALFSIQLLSFWRCSTNSSGFCYYYFFLRVFQSLIIFFINVCVYRKLFSESPFWPGHNVSELHCNLTCFLFMPLSFLLSLHRCQNYISSAIAVIQASRLENMNMWGAMAW